MDLGLVGVVVVVVCEKAGMTANKHNAARDETFLVDLVKRILVNASDEIIEE